LAAISALSGSHTSPVGNVAREGGGGVDPEGDEEVGVEPDLDGDGDEDDDEDEEGDDETSVLFIHFPESRVYPSTHSVGIHALSSSNSYVFLTAFSSFSSSVGTHASPSAENNLGFRRQYIANPNRPNIRTIPIISPIFFGLGGGRGVGAI